MRPGIAFAVMMGVVTAASGATAEPSAPRRDQLRDIIAQDCGSCHGMTRKGGLGAPLLPELLAQYPAEGLIDTILEGRPGTPMPPWKSMLSRDDAVWMVAYLLGEVK